MKHVTRVLFLLLLMLGTVSFANGLNKPVLASDGSYIDTGGSSGGNPTAFSGDCNDGGVKVSITVNKGDKGCVGGGGVNPIYAYLKGIIKFMSGLFGIVAVLMVMFSGFQYMTSGGSADVIKKAKKRLVNVVLSIILFAMMFGILSYIIPGGVL